MTPSTSPAPEAHGPVGHGASTDPEVRARILSQRAARYARRDQAEDDGQHVRLLFFSHGNSDYAISLEDLREVRVLRGFCPIPGARPVVPGIFYYRGEVLSIHDLSAFMGTQTGAESHWVLIVERDKQRLGIMAKDVVDVREVAQVSVRPSPITLGERSVCVQGVVDKNTLLLRTEALFSTPSFFRGL